MAGPTGDQRSILAKIVGRDSLSDCSMQFLSRELRGLEPEAYKEVFLDDLVLLEAADEDNDPLERFVVNAVLRLLRAFRGCKMVRLMIVAALPSIYTFQGSLLFLILIVTHAEIDQTRRYRERSRGQPCHPRRPGLPVGQEDVLSSQ